VPDPAVVLVDIVPVTGPVFVHPPMLLLDGHRPVQRNASLVQVRPLSVLGPRWRSARDNEDEKSKCGSHVVSPLAIARTTRAIEQHDGIEHVECQTVICDRVNNHTCDVHPGAAQLWRLCPEPARPSQCVNCQM
jgi:hypothetical protein